MKSKSAHTDMVQAGVLAPFVRVLEEGGGTVDAVFRSCHLPTSAIADPGVWLPKGQVHWLAERAARHSGEATLGLRAGSAITLQELGGLGAAIGGSATLLEAGQRAHRSIGSIVSGADCWVQRDGGQAWFCYRPEHRFERGGQQGEQFDLAMLLQFVRLATGPDWLPTRIRTVFDHGTDFARHEDFGEAESIRHPHTSAIGFPLELLGRPLPRQQDPVGNKQNHAANDTLSGSLSRSTDKLKLFAISEQIAMLQLQLHLH